MDNKKETIKIKIEEKYGDCLSDSCNSEVKESIRRPQGFVKIYMIEDGGEEQLVGKSNLVLYRGRELIAQRIVNKENSLSTPSKDEFINWLAVGEGGALIGTPFTPIPPTNLDTSLTTEVPMHATDATNCTDWDSTASVFNKHIIDGVVFEQDSDNDNSWLVVRITSTIGTDDALKSEAGDYSISEAGLFTADSAATGVGNTGPFNLFARVTFPSITKTSTRELIFVWYIYT